MRAVNDQELFQRVGELATRVGYPVPAINRTDAANDGPYACVHVGSKSVGPTMHLRSDVGEIRGEVLDFLVAQELVAARNGVFDQRRRLQVGLGVVYGFSAVILVWVTDVGFPLNLLMAVSAYFLIHRVVAGVWWRWFLRRVDQSLVELLGVTVVADGLRWTSALQDWPKDLRWLWRGAPPGPMDRLAWLRTTPAQA